MGHSLGEFGHKLGGCDGHREVSDGAHSLGVAHGAQNVSIPCDLSSAWVWIAHVAFLSRCYKEVSEFASKPIFYHFCLHGLRVAVVGGYDVCQPFFVTWTIVKLLHACLHALFHAHIYIHMLLIRCLALFLPLGMT